MKIDPAQLQRELESVRAQKQQAVAQSQQAANAVQQIIGAEMAIIGLLNLANKPEPKTKPVKSVAPAKPKGAAQ